MRFVVKREDALAPFWREDETGALFAMVCAKGFMRALGRPVKKGETVCVEVTVTEVWRELEGGKREQK